MATTQGCINDMTKALISAHFALRPHHVANDAQRDEHATKMNTVAQSMLPYLFIRGYIMIFVDIYSLFSYLASQYFLRVV